MQSPGCAREVTLSRKSTVLIIIQFIVKGGQFPSFFPFLHLSSEIAHLTKRPISNGHRHPLHPPLPRRRHRRQPLPRTNIAQPSSSSISGRLPDRQTHNSSRPATPQAVRLPLPRCRHLPPHHPSTRLRTATATIPRQNARATAVRTPAPAPHNDLATLPALPRPRRPGPHRRRIRAHPSRAHGARPHHHRDLQGVRHAVGARLRRRRRRQHHRGVLLARGSGRLRRRVHQQRSREADVVRGMAGRQGGGEEGSVGVFEHGGIESGDAEARGRGGVRKKGGGVQ
ncbi:hypothetical protein B0J12DRAFT_109516 [Macrophomina phaseolina]|uniref:Uncharacterized protein n=1 Tax=Macrophomina phaseolina TaxID=35725 RepID=A0ABQ8G8F5_9PEZI|nr:hypothetical protein B0J12DRAFT_109516 [Macrophomina phaseolina]